MRTIVLAGFVGCTGVGPEAQEDGDPCEVPGAICTWVGVPEIAKLGEDGSDRREFTMYLPIDAEPSPDGSLLLTDFGQNRVVSVGSDGVARVVAGTGTPGDGPATAPAAETCWDGCDAAEYQFFHPSATVADPADPATLWVAAWGNNRIVRVDVATGTATWWAGTGDRFYAAGVREEVILNAATSIAVDPATGDLYVSDAGNQLLRVIRPDGRVEDVAGQPEIPGFAGDGCPADQALLRAEVGRQADPSSRITLVDGVLYLTDTGNDVVRAIDLASGTIGTVAGLPEQAGYAGDGGPATEALFDGPWDVAIGPDGSLYVADTGNHCIRRVDPSTGVIETFAGRCTVQGFAGDEGPAGNALFDAPGGVSVDADGNVFVADTNNHVIRRIAAVTSGGQGRIVPPPAECDEG